MQIYPVANARHHMMIFVYLISINSSSISQLQVTDRHQLSSVAIKSLCITSQIFSQDKNLKRALDKNLYSILKNSSLSFCGDFCDNPFLTYATLYMKPFFFPNSQNSNGRYRTSSIHIFLSFPNTISWFRAPAIYRNIFQMHCFNGLVHEDYQWNSGDRGFGLH